MPKSMPKPGQNTKCPSCQKSLRLPPQFVGKRVLCPSCKTPFAPKPEIPVAIEVSSADSDETDLNFDLPSTNPTDGRPLVFISHAQEDCAYVDEHLRGFLRSHGVESWWSQTGIDVGDDWEKKIADALESCHWMILVMSPSSVASPYVQKEVAWCLANRPDKLLPILIEKCAFATIHPELAKLQHSDFTNDPVEARRRILESLVKKLHTERVAAKRDHAIASRKIQALEQDCSFLKRDVDQKNLTIQNAIEFDGNWSLPPRNPPPPFLPLAKRETLIVSFFNLKGGVGKSTLTTNLGATFWGPKFHKKTLLIDLDYQGSTTRTCIGPERTDSLRQQDRTSGRLFRRDLPANLIPAIAEQIVDTNSPNHKAKIIGTDEELHHSETQAMIRWLLSADNEDIRYRLRTLLHTPASEKRFDLVLIDCPPRLTCGAVNALMASDVIIVPTMLDDLSTEAVPRLLNWLNIRVNSLFPHLKDIGVVINRPKKTLREKELLIRLKEKCDDAWRWKVTFYKNSIPTFVESAMNRDFAAHDGSVKDCFAKLAEEILNGSSLPPPDVAASQTQKG